MNQNQARILIGVIVIMVIFGSIILYREEIPKMFQAKSDLPVGQSSTKSPDQKDKMIALNSDGSLIAKAEVVSEITELTIDIPDKIKLLRLLNEWGLFGYTWVIKDKVYIRENGNSTKSKPVEIIRFNLRDSGKLGNVKTNMNNPLKSVSIAVNDGVVDLQIFIDKNNIEALHPSVQESVLRSVYFLTQSREESKKTAEEIAVDYIKVSHDLDLNNAIYLRVIEK